jgi:hypothetical protein
VSNATNLFENGLADLLFRGQALSLPASWHVALLSAVADAEAGTVTDLSGSGYARQPLSRSLAAMSGTQGAGTTTASTGTGGRTSNNAVLTFGPATAAWAAATHVALMDAPTGGAAVMVAPLSSPRTAGTGDTLSFAADALGITVA